MVSRRPLFWLTLSCLLLAPIAFGQVNIAPGGNVVTAPGDIIAVYQQAMNQWVVPIKSAGIALFWILAGLDIAWLGIDLTTRFRAGAPASGIFMTIGHKALILIMFFSLLLNAPSWLPIIIDFFPHLARVASGVQAIGASQIFATGLNLCGAMISAGTQSTAFLDIPAGVAFYAAALGIILAFAILTLQFMLAVLETLLAVVVGYIFAAFGGSRWTAPYVERYFSYAVSAGLKLMTMYFLVGLGQAFSANWATQVNNVGWQSFSVQFALMVLGGVVLYVGFCWFASKLIAGVLGGSPSLTGSDGIGIIGAAITAIGAGAALASGVGAPASAGVAAAGAGGTAAASGGGGAVAAGAGAGATSTASYAATSTAASSAPVSAPVGAAAASGGADYPHAPSSNGGSSAAKGIADVAGGASRVLGKLPHSGWNGTAPPLKGFDHNNEV